MTQVKTLHFDNTDSEMDYLKVTYKSGDVILLDTDQRGDVASVLQDLDDGLFDMSYGGWFDSESQVAAWNVAHPKAQLIYGE